MSIQIELKHQDIYKVYHWKIQNKIRKRDDVKDHKHETAGFPSKYHCVVIASEKCQILFLIVEDLRMEEE
jgi:hypothetical protein